MESNADEAGTIIFWVPGLAVAFGLYLNHRIFNTLATRHPRKYKELGKPHLVFNNTFSNNILFLRFLFGRHWGELGDPKLSRLCFVLYIFSIVYVLGLFGLFVAIATGAAS